MAIIVLAVSCMPCMDSGFVVKAGKNMTELTKSHSQPDNNPSDNCSPFCICSCCAGFSIQYSIIEAGVILPEYNARFSSRYIASVINISLPIWQPPQLAS